MAAEPQRDHRVLDGREAVKGRPLSQGAAAFYDAVWDSARRGSLSLLRQRGATEVEAEEIFAEVFATVMGKVDPIGRAFKEAQMVNLLKVSCERQWINENRHRSVIREVTLADAESISDPRQEGPDELVERSQAIEVGKEAVLSLPERDQTVFRLRYQQDLSPEEIQAEVPGLSARAYRKIIQRANARVLTAYESIERGERCQEVQGGLLARFAAGDADADEVVAVEVHLRHCRSCQRACLRMRGHLRDIGSSLAVVGLTASSSLSSSASEVTQEIVKQAESIGPATRGLRERGREILFKLPGLSPGPTGEATLGQALGVSGKVVAACLGGLAATTTCAAVLVAPGVGLLSSPESVRPSKMDEQQSGAAAAPTPPADVRAPVRPPPGMSRQSPDQGSDSDRDGAREAGRRAETWTAERGPTPKPRSKVINSGQEAAKDWGIEADGAGSYVSPAEIEAATAPSGSSSSSGNSPSAPSGGAGGGSSAPSTSGGSPEFGM